MKESDIVICGHGSGNPSKKNMKEYLSNRYAQIAKNGKHKGIVAVRRLKKLTDADRKTFVKQYNVIIGRNIYNQTLRGYVYTKYKDGRYYSDCSSSGMATFKKLGYKLKWLYNTAAIFQEDEFEDVPVVIVDGHIMNPEVLKVGDCLLFVGSDPSRPKQIGHVEYVYSMPKADKNTTVEKAKAVAKPSLRKGDKGYEVRTLQDNLNDVYAKKVKAEALVVDGIFGQKTFDMLKKWQKKNKLLVDGIYGVKSAAKMSELIRNKM